tara:strand:+ start:78 stop:449 length:372 start_codon:yes stop_codon:yes gene_type:complete
MLNYLSKYFEKSTLLIGLSIIIMNLGGGYIRKEVPDYIEEFFNTPILRRFFIFIVVLIYTKDIGTAIIVTLLFIIIFSILLNEKSKYCILTENMKEQIQNKNKPSKTEIMNCLQKVNEYMLSN